MGGALVRDVLINEQPEHFKPGSFYELAAAPGCVAYFAMRGLELPVLVSALITVAVLITSGMSSWSLNWRTGGRGAASADTGVSHAQRGKWRVRDGGYARQR